MLEYVWVIPLVPVASFFIILAFGRHLPKKGSEVGIGALGLAFVLSAVAAAEWIGKAEPRHPVEAHETWFELGGVEIGAGMHVDGLTIMMLLVVTFISLMVHVYSTGYMHGDRRFTYFFAALSLFTASMLNLVVADNTLQLLMGWELVGLCSFMLIGHWWEEQANSDAAIKAFITTHIGDVGLMLGVILLFFAAGQTFEIETINQQALTGGISHGLLLTGGLLLFLGVMGKSAQFPLHVWLPDAMAGPTPVSALIHAATMVVAGVYLIARLYGVFWAGFSIEMGGINFVALTGGITVIIAAGLAFVQDDVKKVLAYSTVSQLGYMVMALGVGSWTAGVFHLYTHAAFKALLFLGAGSLIHAVHSNNMSDMGGMRKFMPTTFWTFIVGSVALAGIFPLAGFWSKDEIINGASNDYQLFMVVGLIGAFMTAAYMTRVCILVFAGEYRGHGHPHESPPSMVWPLRILAVLSVCAGWVNATPFGIHEFANWVRFEIPGVPEFLEEHAFDYGLAAASLAVAGLGALAATAYYQRSFWPRGLAERNAAARWGYRFLVNKYYLDALFLGIIRAIQYPIARAAYWVNQHVIDAAVNGVATGARQAGKLTYDVIDQKVIDGAVNGAGFSAEEGGIALRHTQSGRVQQYAAYLFGASALLAVGLALFT
jgi:NADH-quinone oxidoreductase subunit L